MRDRRDPPPVAPEARHRPMTRLRNALALVVVIAALLAVAASIKRETCTCSGPGVPYSTIAVGAAVVAAASLAAYVAAGVASRRR